MTIQDLGSLGELIAAMATIATLAYLAVQIRQNTHTVRAASTTAHIESVSAFSMMLGQSKELSDLYFTGLSGEAELDESEDRQFQMLIGGFLLALQHAFLLDEESVVHPEITAYHNETVSWLAAQPGFRRYWNIWGETYPPHFRGHVNDKLNTSKS
jgi:hypothetical protein